MGRCFNKSVYIGLICALKTSLLELLISSSTKNSITGNVFGFLCSKVCQSVLQKISHKKFEIDKLMYKPLYSFSHEVSKYIKQESYLIKFSSLSAVNRHVICLPLSLLLLDLIKLSTLFLNSSTQNIFKNNTSANWRLKLNDFGPRLLKVPSFSPTAS